MSCVIKLGGSLLDAAVMFDCLSAVGRYADRVVIVPGGGMFAEQVRIAQGLCRFDDVAAHRMAILAMQQMALLMHSLQPGFAIVDKLESMRSAWQIHRVLIWSPQVDQLDSGGVSASWDISSDSLAAWLAGQIGADELLLVKSASIADAATLPVLQQQGIVDAAFLHFTNHADYKITVINKDRFLSRHD